MKNIKLSILKSLMVMVMLLMAVVRPLLLKEVISVTRYRATHHMTNLSAMLAMILSLATVVMTPSLQEQAMTSSSWQLANWLTE